MPDKGDDAGGGLSNDLFGAIIGQLGGGGAKGTPQEQAAVLLELAREEHAALYPGNGNASLADAMAKYGAIVEATAQLTAATTPAQATAAIEKLAPAINGLGKLWATFGPVVGAFSESVKNKP